VGHPLTIRILNNLIAGFQEDSDLITEWEQHPLLPAPPPAQQWVSRLAMPFNCFGTLILVENGTVRTGKEDLVILFFVEALTMNYFVDDEYDSID